MGIRDSVSVGKATKGMKLTTHLHLVLRSRMHGVIPPLPQYAFMAWCSVKEKHRDNFTFYLLPFNRQRTSFNDSHEKHKEVELLFIVSRRIPVICHIM
jgi:hypothetical protein